MTKLPIPPNGEMSPDERDLICAINRIEDWQGEKVTYKEVPIGITNPTWCIRVDSKRFFIKIPGKGTEKFIDRDAVHLANIMAADAGCGPGVAYWFPDTKVEVFEWLEGYTACGWKHAYKEAVFLGMIDAMKKFHDTQGDLGHPANAFDQTWKMIELARSGDGLEPFDMERAEWLLHRVEDAFNKDGMKMQPCHNDTYIINFMYNEDTKDVKMVDFEYASMGDISYDLAVFSTDEFYEDPHDMLIIKRYFGEFDERQFARLKLMKLVSDIKWGMWASVQALSSTLDFDFIRYHGWKFARLRSHWVDPRIDYWINLLNKKPLFY
jgi:thiamine kinase-like enzyme